MNIGKLGGKDVFRSVQKLLGKESLEKKLLKELQDTKDTKDTKAYHPLESHQKIVTLSVELSNKLTKRCSKDLTGITNKASDEYLKSKSLLGCAISLTNNVGPNQARNVREMTNLISFYIASNCSNQTEVLATLTVDSTKYDQDRANITESTNLADSRNSLTFTTHCLSDSCTKVVRSMVEFIQTSVDTLALKDEASGGGGDPVDMNKLRRYIHELANPLTFGDKESDLVYLKEIIDANLVPQFMRTLNKCKDKLTSIQKSTFVPQTKDAINKLLSLYPDSAAAEKRPVQNKKTAVPKPPPLVSQGSNPLITQSDPGSRASPVSVQEFPRLPLDSKRSHWQKVMPDAKSLDKVEAGIVAREAAELAAIPKLSEFDK